MVELAVFGCFEKLDPFSVFSILARSDFRSSYKKVAIKAYAASRKLKTRDDILRRAARSCDGTNNLPAKFSQMIFS